MNDEVGVTVADGEVVLRVKGSTVYLKPHEAKSLSKALLRKANEAIWNS